MMPSGAAADTPDIESTADDSRPKADVALQFILQAFFGSINASGANFGIGGSDVLRPFAPQPRTGPLPVAEVEQSLEHYIDPSSFPAAVTILSERGLVVLRAHAGMGKRAGALALLRTELDVSAFVGLSPALSLAELLRYEFSNGHGYFVLDRVGGRDARETIDYDFAELSRALLRAQVKLVITTTAPVRELPYELCVEWTTPAPRELLRKCMSDLRISLPERDLDERVERDLANATPAEIVELARSLTDQGIESNALPDLLERTRRDTVTRWFENEPAEGDVLLLTVLCFSAGRREAVVEDMLAGLEAKLEEGDADQAIQDVPTSAERPEISQKRHARLETIPMVTRGEMPSGAKGSGERQLSLASDAYVGWVLSELWARYDRTLWEPVTRWLHGLFEDVVDDTEALSLARGLAGLAASAPEHVRITYLEPLASGSTMQRRTACYALWYAALDDTLASWALGTATDWASADDTVTQLSAVLSLIGPLGLRFPGEAMRQLWRLARRPAPVETAAQEAIVSLVYGSAEQGNHEATALRFLAAKVAPFPVHPREPQRSAAMAVIDRLLQANDARGTPLLAILARSAADTESLGIVCARAILSRPHRATAMRAVTRTLCALQEIDADLTAVRTLGSAIVNRLPAHELPLVEHELMHQLTRSTHGAAPEVRSLVAALLGNAAHDQEDNEEVVDEPVSDP